MNNQPDPTRTDGAAHTDPASASQVSATVEQRHRELWRKLFEVPPDIAWQLLADFEAKAIDCAAAARAAIALGYDAIQTFILASEPGTSLIAAGWKCCGPSAGGDWNRPSRGNRRVDQPQEPKIKYEKVFL
jgi:hypothetical protein